MLRERHCKPNASNLAKASSRGLESAPIEDAVPTCVTIFSTSHFYSLNTSIGFPFLFLNPACVHSIMIYA
jgi:hypothetical protein